MWLVVLTEQSSSEPEALGRVEWIKLFGVLFDNAAGVGRRVGDAVCTTEMLSLIHISRTWMRSATSRC